ncbi:hypothetical protein HN911_09980 [Candidatus Bathyarchaeota archaeon]|nr:hypothetical protein [Candidatus Bathyarchaeota archaeon]
MIMRTYIRDHVVAACGEAYPESIEKWEWHHWEDPVYSTCGQARSRISAGGNPGPARQASHR